MLQVLQYFVGTSMAALLAPVVLTMVQAVIGGPNASGSSESSGGGNGWRFRGRICSLSD